MTPERLQELKKLCDEAQRGPWYPADDGIYTDDLDYDHKIELSKENASFIAASRTALPELIAEVERLTKQVDKLEKHYADEWHRACSLDFEKQNMKELLHDLNAVLKTAMHNGHHDLIQRVSDVCKGDE